jgi:putative salt-induced outer membrane protein YdiY
MLKKLLIVGGIAIMTLPTAACLDGLTSALTGAATDATQQVLDDVDAGIQSGQAASQSMVDDYIAQIGNGGSEGGGGTATCTIAEQDTCNAMSLPSDTEACLAACGGV